MSINSIQKTSETSPNLNYINIKIQDEYFLLIKSISKLLEEIIYKNKKKSIKVIKIIFTLKKFLHLQFMNIYHLLLNIQELINQL